MSCYRTETHFDLVIMTMKTASRRYGLSCPEHSAFINGPSSAISFFGEKFTVGRVLCFEYPPTHESGSLAQAFDEGVRTIIRLLQPYRRVLLDGYDNHDYAGIYIYICHVYLYRFVYVLTLHHYKGAQQSVPVCYLEDSIKPYPIAIFSTPQVKLQTLWCRASSQHKHTLLHNKRLARHSSQSNTHGLYILKQIGFLQRKGCRLVLTWRHTGAVIGP